MEKTKVEDRLALMSDMDGVVRNLRQASPEVMKAFSEMSRAAHVGEAPDGKTEALVALAIGVAVRCDPCIAYHVEGAIRQGASPRVWRRARIPRAAARGRPRPPVILPSAPV